MANIHTITYLSTDASLWVSVAVRQPVLGDIPTPFRQCVVGILSPV